MSPSSTRAFFFRLMAIALLACVNTAPAWPAALDEVTLKNGRKYVGTIVSDSPEALVLSIDGGTVRIPRSTVQSPPFFGSTNSIATPGQVEAAAPMVRQSDNPLPDLASTLAWLRTFAWSAPMEQIPVQVTDRGRWPFLPALAFRAGDFFQIHVFGDPEDPAAIEVSLVENEHGSWENKGRLLEFMLGLVPGLAVDSRFATLKIGGDSFAVDDLWFSITRATGAETPGRWTVYLMHERSLSPARASFDELEAISEPVRQATIDPSRPRSWQKGSWTPEQLEWLQRNGQDLAAAPLPDDADAGSIAQLKQWIALNSSRVFVRSFARVNGRYVRTDRDWLTSDPATPQ